MQLSALAGNRSIKEQLAFQAEGRGLGHAYILSGPPGSGRHTLANLMAAALVCGAGEGERPCGRCVSCRKAAGGIHPDVIRCTGPEGKPVTVDQVRQLRADAHIRPNEAPRKVYLLERADRMNPPAQNAMLKLLEDGPAYAAFLLLAENGGGLLETIRSRCESLALQPVPAGECRRWLGERFPQTEPARLDRAAEDCQGILGRAVSALEGTDGESRALAERAGRLASLLERGDELELFRETMELEKLSREELTALLERTETEIARLLPRSGEKARLLRAAALAEALRGAAQLNANTGQLAGWLCAGNFIGMKGTAI